MKCGIFYERVAGRHLRCTHGISTEEYLKDYPGALLEDEELTLQRSESLSEALTGRVFTEEWCERIREWHTDRPLSEAHKEAISEGHIGIPRSVEHCRALSEARLGMKFSDEWCRNISIAKKAYCASESGRLSRISEFETKSKTKLDIAPFLSMEELLLDSLLLEKEWKYTGDGAVLIGGMCPDFLNANGKKKVIEYFGSHWHDEYGDKDRSDRLEEWGYESLIIWDFQLKAASKSFESFCVLMQRISDFAYSESKLVVNILPL